MSLEDVVRKRIAKKQEEGIKQIVTNLNTLPQKTEELHEGLEFVKASQGNVGQAIGGTAADIGLSLARGFTSVSEGLADALTYLGAGIAELHGKKAFAAALRNDTQVNLTDQLLRVKAVEDNSVLGRTSQGILEGVGQGFATVATGAVGGAGLSGATMFVSGTGHGMTEALQEGATANEAALYGLISGGVDAITEALAGGLGKGAKALGISKGIAGIDDKIASVLSKNVKNKLVSNLIQAGVKATGEGVEEALSYAGQTLAKKLTYLSEKDWNELWSNQELLENFVAGTLSSAILQAPDVVTSTKRGQDFVTGRTGDEQAVIDKLYNDRVAAQETDGKKLTTKEKGKILDQVEQEYERGEIAVETIEEALGGDTYQQYVEASKKQKDLQKEFDDLNNMKKGEMTGVQEDRLQELRQQLKTMSDEDAAGKLQKQYQEEVRQKASKGQLAESYNQREQRGQAYKADLAQYNEKQQATVQKAMDSGILNNTRKSHDFVDLIAKISEDTGADFDFTDNQRLKESGFALEGVTVNGYTNGKTVSVNINSAKALNTVVGHEIMHVLEGTELANKLQERILAYADSKGELQSRRDTLQKLYQNTKADIDKELTADLVGDYIFSDIDFVRNLKSGDRDLFDRIYDEVKHMVKLATAGSKEARELEKVKKMFADVYREADAEKNTVVEDGVRYSLAKVEDITPSDKQKEQNVREVAEMNPVCRIDASKLIHGEKSIKEIYQEFFAKWGGNIHSELFGDIAVRNSSVRSEMRHGSTPVKVASIEAIPNVIQSGKIVEWIKKDSGLFRIVVAAPIEIGETPYFMGVMLQRDAQNQRLYLHDVVIEKEAFDPSREHLDSTGPREESENLYTSSILDKIAEVKKKLSLSAEGDVAPDRGGVYGKDIRLETAMQAPEESKAIKLPEKKKIEAPVKEQAKAKAAEAPAAQKVAEVPVKAEAKPEAPVQEKAKIEAPAKEQKAETEAQETVEGRPLPENYEAKAPKEGMQPVVSPVVKLTQNTRNVDKAQMSQEEAEYYQEKEGKTVKTFRELMTIKAGNLTKNIADIRVAKQKVAADFDAKIEKLQSEYDGLKNKTTIRANQLQRSIENKKLQKANRLAEYNKRLYDLQKRVERTEERILNDTGREDYIRSKIEAIDEKLKAEKDQLLEKQEKEREDLEKKTESREIYVAERAMELYDELRKLKKGVKASEDLGFLLDQGYSWNAIKSALLLVNDKPAGGLNTRFEAEKTVRELLGRRYEDALEDVQLLEQTQANELQKLEDEAKDRRAALQAALIKKQRMEQYEGEAEMLVGDSGGWKDMKTGMGYATQTMRRYMRDIVRDLEGNQQIEKADAITDYLQGSYNLNEAALKLEARKRKAKFAALKLNKYESAYAQMLGEMKYGPGGDEKSTLEYDAVTYLEAFKDKINLGKVEQAVEMARAEYEELFVLINQTLRSQGFREMPYRKGYFPHFTDKTQNFVQKLLNWKPNTDEIPTSIAGRTEEFKPQRSWQSFIQKRKGIRTDYDLLKGYDNYLNGALDWIYHIADIQRMRAFENFLRYTHSEEGVQARIEEIKDNLDFTAEEAQDEIDKVIKNYKNPLNNLVVELRRKTNTLAAKKSAFDRETEEYMGRPSYSMLTNITSRASANQVAGNLASALTNVIPIIQSSAEVSPKWTFEAVKETLKSTQNDDGIIERSTFLTNRLRQNESLIKNNWDKIGDVLSIPMEYMDAFASQVVWRSKYLQNKKKGMTETEAIKNADQFAENVIAGRSRGNMPTIFDSKNILFKTFTAFQLEVANQYGYFFKDLPTKWKKEAAAEKKANGGKTPAKTIAKATAGVASVLMGSYVYNWVAEAITGNASATDPIRILEKIIRQAIREIEDDDEETTGKEIASVFKTAMTEILEEVPYVGGPLGGGRISSAAAMPYGSIQDLLQNLPDDVGEGNWKSLGKELLNVLYYGVLPMGGGQIKKINEGIGMYLDTSEEFPFLPKAAETPGSYTTSGGLRYAVEPTVWNVIQSVLFGQYANENARRYFDEGKTPLSEEQLEEFQSVDMDMDEYWDYRDDLKAAGSKTADKIDVVMGLDLPVEQKNILANNIAKREEPIDLTGADKFGSFAEFDFYIKDPEKYQYLKANGVTVAEYEAMDKAEKEVFNFRYNNESKFKFLSSQGIRVSEYLAMSDEKKAEIEMLQNSPKKLEFLQGKGITAAEYEEMDEAEKAEIDFQYNNPNKYAFLKKEGITVAAYQGFDKTTKTAWDWAASNPEKYEFLKKEGVTMDEYKLLSESAKDDWKWAANNPDKYKLSKAVTDDLYEYRRYQDKIAGISGDNKQEKILAYINSLDIAEGAKAILFKMKYPKNDDYNRQVVQYVVGLDMTYAEKKAILTQLGFQVDSNGKITG